MQVVLPVASALTKKGINPISLVTIATVSMDNETIKEIHLSINGIVPGISNEEFIEVAGDAKKNCIISKVLSVPISSEAHLIIKK